MEDEGLKRSIGQLAATNEENMYLESDPSRTVEQIALKQELSHICRQSSFNLLNIDFLNYIYPSNLRLYVYKVSPDTEPHGKASRKIRILAFQDCYHTT